MKVEGLRSPQKKVGGLYHFGRMIDKIRLFCEGKLPEEYLSFRGLATGLDGHLCSFLEINYDQLEERVKAGGTDEDRAADRVGQGRVTVEAGSVGRDGLVCG